MRASTADNFKNYPFSDFTPGTFKVTFCEKSLQILRNEAEITGKAVEKIIQDRIFGAEVAEIKPTKWQEFKAICRVVFCTGPERTKQ